MGWSIALMENTAVVPEDRRVEVALSVIANGESFWEVRELQEDEPWSDKEFIDAVFYEGKLIFNSDDMEHMDYVCGDEAICRAMAAAGTSGRILFGSLEGDDSGSFWGVEFASGHYRIMSGKVQWTPGTSFPR